MERKRFFSLTLIAVLFLISASSVTAFPNSIFFFRDKSSPLVELEFFVADFSQVNWQTWCELAKVLKRAGYCQVKEEKYYETTYPRHLKFIWEAETREIEVEEFIPVGVKIYEFKGIITLESALKRVVT